MSWRHLGIAAGSLALAGIVGAALMMAINLVWFERAGVCSSASSRNCIHVSMGTITSPGRQEDNSWCGTGPAGGCHDRVDHSIVVTPEGSTHEVELWDTQEHPDFVVGDTVKLERWHGQYIAVTAGDNRVEVNDWNPQLLKTLLILAPVSALLITLLWRFKVISLDEGLKGLKARLKSALGLLVLMYGSVFLIFFFWVAVPVSSPLLYLR